MVNLDDIGDNHVRSFLMGLILIRLREERHGDSDGRLLHLTVIDEAHRLLGAAHPHAASGSAGALAGAGAGTAEEIADLLAEIRSSGEGILVADQSPSRLVPGVMANTATKIALRADADADQAALGAALGLNIDSRPVLGGLVRHEALLSWEGTDAPVLGRLGSLRLRPTPTRKPSRRPPSTRMAQPDSGLRSLVRSIVRVAGVAAAPIRSALLANVRDHLRTMHPASSTTAADIDAAVTDLLRREIEVLGRARNWDDRLRSRALTAVLAGTDGPDHPQRLLQDGRRPFLACTSVCPNGGCLVGEPARTEVDRIQAEGPATIVRLAADPQERRRRLGRRALEVTAADAPPALRTLTLGCITAVLFDDWADPTTVAGLVTETVAAD